MKKIYIISSIFGLVSLVSFAAFNMIGSSFSPEGVLIEPFWLIPLGYIMALCCLISLIVAGFMISKKAR